MYEYACHEGNYAIPAMLKVQDCSSLKKPLFPALLNRPPNPQSPETVSSEAGFSAGNLQIRFILVLPIPG